MTMIPVDRMIQGTGRCRICLGTGEARAPFFDTLIDEDEGFRPNRIYICWGCIVEAVHQRNKKDGLFELIPVADVKALRDALEEASMMAEIAHEDYKRLEGAVELVSQRSGGLRPLTPEDLDDDS